MIAAVEEIVGVLSQVTQENLKKKKKKKKRETERRI